MTHYSDGIKENQYDGGGEVLVAKYHYDLNDDGTKRQSTETDGQGNQRTFYWSYDSDGRLISEAMAGPDADDPGTAGIDEEDDYVATYRYDLTGNRLEKDVDNHSTGVAAFVNDPSAFAPDETITYTYDSNDRLLTEVDDAADPADDAHTVYGYPDRLLMAGAKPDRYIRVQPG